MQAPFYFATLRLGWGGQEISSPAFFLLLIALFGLLLLPLSVTFHRSFLILENALQ